MLKDYADDLEPWKVAIEASQEHEDKMLTWLTGLMGAALFALPSILAGACSERQSLRIVAFPWVFGVLLALVGRAIGRQQREANWMFYRLETLNARVALRDLLTSSSGNVEEAIERWANESRQGEAVNKAIRVERISSILYYASIFACAAGIIAVYVAISDCGAPERLWATLKRLMSF